MIQSFAHTLKKASFFTALVGVVLTGVIIFIPQSASAEYTEHNLIEDNLFLDANSMSHQSIQDFLSARQSYLAGYTTWSDRDNATVSASQIIYEAAQDYGISPKVILATLQKEQSLVTAQNPSSSQLNFAMGYGCPDSTGCGEKYRGFYRQVDNATWQFRFNYETSRGNKWWNPNLSYPCGGSTRYYSPGLIPGNYVTWYDDAGTAYKSFTINNGATASLYCYTPHAYPGSANQYYSGSYNFVKMYELWFGSTQPTVVVSSPLFLTAAGGPVAHADRPLTAWFTLTNNSNTQIDVGRMTVAVRGANGANYDYALARMVVPAYSTVKYVMTQSFPVEGDFTFWISHLSDSGAWSDTYPLSSSVDNKRKVTANLKLAPIITASPTSTVPEMKQGKLANYSFTVRNPGAGAINLGKMGMAVRAPNGANVDMPLRDVTIPGGGTYTYNEPFRPSMTGRYNAYITNTLDGGRTWNEASYPAVATGINNRISFDVGASPTLTQGPQLSVAKPRIGQNTNLSFKVRNYGDTNAPVGVVGLAIRDPYGRNLDPGAVNLTISPDSEYTFNANSMTFQTPGTYTAWVTVYRNGVWDDNNFPSVDSSSVVRRINFTVLPSPTITIQPEITTGDPRVGKAATATFTMHNYGSTPVDMGYVALAARDPKGRNADFMAQRVIIQPGSDYVYSATSPGGTFQTPGTYTAWVTVYRNGVWDDNNFPSVDNDSIKRKITFDVKPSPTLTQGPQLSVASPSVGQNVNASFKIKNFGDANVDAGIVGLAIRDPLGRNVDAGGGQVTVNANSEYTFAANGISFTMPGAYTAWVTVYRNGVWDDNNFPPAESGAVQRKITFTVQP